MIQVAARCEDLNLPVPKKPRHTARRATKDSAVASTAPALYDDNDERMFVEAESEMSDDDVSELSDDLPEEIFEADDEEIELDILPPMDSESEEPSSSGVQALPQNVASSQSVTSQRAHLSQPSQAKANQTKPKVSSSAIVFKVPELPASKRAAATSDAVTVEPPRAILPAPSMQMPQTLSLEYDFVGELSAYAEARMREQATSERDGAATDDGASSGSHDEQTLTLDLSDLAPPSHAEPPSDGRSSLSISSSLDASLDLHYSQSLTADIFDSEAVVASVNADRVSEAATAPSSSSPAPVARKQPQPSTTSYTTTTSNSSSANKNNKNTPAALVKGRSDIRSFFGSGAASNVTKKTTLATAAKATSPIAVGLQSNNSSASTQSRKEVDQQEEEEEEELELVHEATLDMEDDVALGASAATHLKPADFVDDEAEESDGDSDQASEQGDDGDDEDEGDDGDDEQLEDLIDDEPDDELDDETVNVHHNLHAQWEAERDAETLQRYMETAEQRKQLGHQQSLRAARKDDALAAATRRAPAVHASSSLSSRVARKLSSLSSSSGGGGSGESDTDHSSSQPATQDSTLSLSVGDDWMDQTTTLDLADIPDAAEESPEVLQQSRERYREKLLRRSTSQAFVRGTLQPPPPLPVTTTLLTRDTCAPCLSTRTSHLSLSKIRPRSSCE